MKSKIIYGKNAIKRIFYKGRATKFKKLIAFMILLGLLSSMAYFVKYAYVEYAVARAHVILNYPEIAQSKYPDGSRFTYYDFTCDENLKEALRIMRQDKKYQYFTVDDIRDSFFIYSYLDGSAVSSVSSARSEGNDFSYVANEYKITFVQPHDYKNPNIFKKVFTKNYSEDFLQVLVDVNKAKIAERLGGINGFKTLTEVDSAGDYDYSEEVSVYKTKVNNIVAYLKQLEKEQPDFVSEKYDLSLSDLRGKYSFLISNGLDSINNFVESSGISKDIDQTSNKINVNIENYTVKYNKAVSKVETNDYATKNYDQTFTENLINVIQNDEYGLYQARPKTAFDTVSRQKYESDESVSEYGSKINIFTKELGIYDNVVTTPEEHERLIAKCDNLMAAFRKDYEELSKVANEVIEEYYNDVNEEFISAKISSKGLISKNLIVKMGVAFLLGAMLAFIIAVFALSISDRRKVNKRKQLIESIKAKNNTEGA
ncbi:MAG: hypothetical protein IJE44_03950 [Clostridia bacterium]|nr:hypothetical protein [Clostridia bacterium]